MSINPVRQQLRRLAPALAIALCLATTARAQSTTLSDLSTLSSLPIAVSVAAPVALLAAGATLTIVSVKAASNGTVWVLERAGDGAQASLRVADRSGTDLSIAVGTVVTVTMISTGCILSTAGRAIAFVPNRIGSALIHDERITQ